MLGERAAGDRDCSSSKSTGPSSSDSGSGSDRAIFFRFAVFADDWTRFLSTGRDFDRFLVAFRFLELRISSDWLNFFC